MWKLNDCPCMEGLHTMTNMGSNSGVYNKAATKSPGSFQMSGEPFEMLALHVNSVYIFEENHYGYVLFTFIFCRKVAVLGNETCCAPKGKNCPVHMSCTGKDRTSHLPMCLAWWKIASLIGISPTVFLTVLNLSLCRECCIWKMSKKD